MASEKQLEVVRSGATEWNTWRTQNALVDIDLGGVDLQGVDLRGANLQNGNFRLSNLQGGNLSGANLQGANFSNASMQGVNLMRAEMRNVSFANANLQWANMAQADVRWADMHGCNLRLANLQGTDLHGANLRDPNLLGANLKLTDLEDADLSNVLPRGLHLQVAEQNRRSSDSLEKSDGNVAKASIETFDLWAKTAFDAASKMLGVDVDSTEALKILSEHYRSTPFKASPSFSYKNADGKELVVHQHPYQQLQQNLLLIALQSVTYAQNQSVNVLTSVHLGGAVANLKCLSWPFESMGKERSSSTNT